MKSLAKNTASIATTELLLVFVAIIRNKYLAITIGPEGFGIYSLLASFFSVFSIFAGTWLGSATTKYISEFDNKKDSTQRDKVFTFAFVVVSIIGILITIILVFFRKFIILYFLSKDILESYYLWFAAGFIGLNLRSILLRVLQGLLAVKLVVKSRILIALVDLLSIVSLVYIFHLLGFFVGLFVSTSFAAGILFYFVFIKSNLRFVKFSLKGNISKKMLSFGAYSFITGPINFGSMYLQRFILIQSLGINAVGIFQAGISIMSYMGLVNRGSSFHLLPTMSKNMDNESRAKQLNEYLVFVLIITVPITVFSILFGKIVIHLLYSRAFLSLSNYLYWFLLAEFIIIISTSFQSTVVGMAKLKIHTLAVFIIHSFWIVIPFFFIDKFGIAVLPVGMLIGQVLGGSIYFIYLWKHIDFRFVKRVNNLFIFGIIILLLSFFLQNTHIVWQVLFMFGVTGSTILFLSKKERDKILGIIIQKIK